MNREGMPGSHDRQGDGDKRTGVANFLTEQQLAERWGIRPKTLQKFRYTGEGPAFHKIGASIRYALDDILSFEQASRIAPPAAATRDKLPE